MRPGRLLATLCFGGLLWCVGPSKAEGAPCAPDEQLRNTSRDDVILHTDSVVAGYRAQDVAQVRNALCDIQATVAALQEPLTTRDVAAVHLAYVLEALVVGRPDDRALEFLVAARATDSATVDQLVTRLGEGDPLSVLAARVPAPEDSTTQDERPPEAAAGGAGEDDSAVKAYLEVGTRTLPPPLSGRLHVNGRPEDRTQGGPYLLQLISNQSTARHSLYVLPPYTRPGDLPPDLPYTRLRPAIAIVAATTAAAAGTAYAFGAHYHAQARELPVVTDASVRGDVLADNIEEWEHLRRRNNTSMIVAGGFGALTVGLGAWYATTF